MVVNIKVEEGEDFKICLAFNPSTGFAWRIKFIEHKYIEVKGRKTKCLNTNQCLDCFKFEACKDGCTFIIFEKFRGTEIIEEQMFRVKIKCGGKFNDCCYRSSCNTQFCVPCCQPCCVPCNTQCCQPCCSSFC